MIVMLTVKHQSYILYINFLFLISLPSVSNFNSPFENSWSKRLKNFFKGPAFLLLSQIFNSEFSRKFNFTLTFFGKITSYIIQFSHAFLLWWSSQVKLLKLQIYSLFQTESICWGQSTLSLSAFLFDNLSMLTQSLCLECPFHELAIFIRCTLRLRMIIHFSRC